MNRLISKPTQQKGPLIEFSTPSGFEGRPEKENFRYQPPMVIHENEKIGATPLIQNSHRVILDRTARRSLQAMVPEGMTKNVISRHLQQRLMMTNKDPGIMASVVHEEAMQGLTSKYILNHSEAYPSAFMKAYAIETLQERKPIGPVDE